jgi:hypothetical protein
MYNRRLVSSCYRKQSSLMQLAGFCLASAIMLLATKASAVNILTNPGFESLGATWTVYTPQGSGGNVFEQQNPPAHGGVNVYKNWGCWCANTNTQAIFQDKQASVGNTYTASGYVRRPNNDFDSATQNEGWLQVAFLDAGGATLSLYESFRIGVSTPESVDWSFVSVTNHVDPVTGASLGSVTSFVAPAGTKTVRFSAILEQRNGGGGAWHYDDMSLDQTSGNIPPSILSLAPNGTALFNLAANGITFTASSTTTTISPGGVKLILNGLDVSSGLAFVPGGAAASQSVTYLGLVPDRLYSAVVNVTDDVGYLTSAAINFDTFVAGNFQWEAEDYDYNTANYFNNPTNTSYLAANSYFGRPGTADVDWHESGGWGGNGGQAYRESGVGPGVEWASDFLRAKFAAAQGLDPAVHDYDVGWVSGLDGDWMNYTRIIPAGSYNVYCRLASGDGGNKRCQLGVVTSGVGGISQTVSTLGIGTIVGGAGWQAWQWAPLLDAGGNLVKLTYASATTVTFRVSADGCNMNFFMLAPARTDLPLIDNLYPTGTKPFEPANALSFNASSTVATIPTGNIHVTLNGNNVDALLTIGGTATSRTVSLPYLASNAMYTATISITDSAGTTVSRALSFDTFSESNFSFEAEDYNFGNGQYIANPVLSTTPGANNYFQQGVAAVNDPEAVDISTNPPASGYGIAYQRPDAVGTEVVSDYLRQTYVAAQVGDPGVKDYDIGWDNSGTWFNYTRDIPAGNYRVYARLAGNGILNATMDLVTGATSSSQTTSPLGTLSSTRPSGGWQAWGWVPLIGTGGSPAILSGGTKTLRFTTGGNVNHNYFMLAPAKNVIALSVNLSGSNPVISIPTQAGASYTIQYKSSLTSGTWTYLTMVQGNGTTKTATDTTATGSQRLYRAIIQ